MSARALASAVLHRAVQDADGRPFLGKQTVLRGRRLVKVLRVDRTVESAVTFLCEPNPLMEFWCYAAGLSAKTLREQSRRRYRAKWAALLSARRREVAV